MCHTIPWSMLTRSMVLAKKRERVACYFLARLLFSDLIHFRTINFARDNPSRALVSHDGQSHGILTTSILSFFVMVISLIIFFKIREIPPQPIAHWG